MSVGAIYNASRGFVFNNSIGSVNPFPWVHYETIQRGQLSRNPLGVASSAKLVFSLKYCNEGMDLSGSVRNNGSYCLRKVYIKFQDAFNKYYAYLNKEYCAVRAQNNLSIDVIG